jgi:protein-disulfide isomerase
MRRVILHLVLVAMLLGLPRLAAAQTPTCDGLTGAKRDVALGVLKSQHPYDCCDGTIWDCLRRKPVCRLARRLAEDVCRRAGAGKSQAEIERELQRRAASMMPGGKTYTIDTSTAAVAGNAAAPVTVVAYLCVRCPYCARLAPALYQSVTAGKLQGKAKLLVRVFPIRSHPHSTEGGLALLAAQDLGKFWDFLLHLYANFDRFDPAKLPDCAAAKGMDRKRFVDLMNASRTRDRLVASKKEGVRNKVGATPTLFIDGRMYTADLDIVSVEDAVTEEWERVTGKTKE